MLARSEGSGSKPEKPGPGGGDGITRTNAVASALCYLPNVLVEAICQKPDRAPPWIEPVESSLVLADISGFTALSETLAQAGKEGAEWLASIVSQYFSSMLGIAGSYGGTNTKFGGDALLMLFKGENHARRAVAAALAMQRATRRFTAFRAGSNRVRLNMTVGVHSGVFWSAAAGVPELRMQHFILGKEANRVAETQSAATRGELVISKATLDMLGDLCIVEPKNNTYRVLRLVKRVPARPPEQEADLPPLPAKDILAYLPPTIAQALRAGAQPKGMEGEHRKVTTMFINMMGTNELLEQDGPEAFLNELQRYLSSVVRLSEQYGGFLVSNDVYTLGLKLIITFGAPVAREQNAASALRLALDLKREAARLNVRFSHRVGIHSGFVFAGDVGPTYCRQYTVMGDAVNLSARLMSAASPDQIIISKGTMTEAGPGFAIRDLPAIKVKGKKEPVPIGILEGETASSPASLFEQRGGLFGRETEICQLEDICREAEQGKGQNIIISGDAGIGKSRLCLEFQEQLRSRKWVVYQGVCFSHTAAKPFAPWTDILNAFFDITPNDDPSLRTEKVRNAISRLRPDLLEMASLLNPLLGVFFPQSDVVHFLTDEARRQRLFQLIMGLFAAATAASPAALIVEDLQWADGVSLQLINHLGSDLGSSRLLLCLTYRPVAEMVLALPQASTTVMALSELPRDASLQLLESVLNRAYLPDQVANAVLEKAKGNPLFLEELARAIGQSGMLNDTAGNTSHRLARDFASMQIPDRLQTLMMSRIDTIGDTTKEVLRAASVIGSPFDAATVHALVEPGLKEVPLEQQLQELVRLDLTYQEEAVPQPAYRFRHTLIQEVVYDSLLFARRRELHRRVASYLEDSHQGQLEPFYEILVHHFSRSQEDVKTRVYALKAADKARQLFAHEEAIEYYHVGLDTVKEKGSLGTSLRCYFVEHIGDSYEVLGRHQEASLHLVRALRQWRRVARKSNALTSVPVDLSGNQPAGTREAVLCHKISVSHERNSEYDLALKWLASALRVLPARQPLQAARITITRSVALFRKGLYEEAIDWGRQGLTLSRRSGDRAQIAYAHNMLASSYLELGRLKLAIRHRHSALSILEETRDMVGQAIANNNLGAGYQLLGLLDKALHHYELALKANERIANPSAAAIAHNNIGEVFLTQGEIDKAIYHLKKVVETYDKTGDPLAATGLALVNLSRAYQRQRSYPEAMASLQRGGKLLQKAGARGLMVENRLQWAELQLETNKLEPAWRICERGLKDARQMGMKLLEARGLRIRGRIFTRRGRLAEAAADLRQSITLADNVNADYEKGMALLHLAELRGINLNEKGSRYRCEVALKQAIEIFERMGAQMDMAQALDLQNSFGL